MSQYHHGWLRAGLVYLGASSLIVGLWATASPADFYEGFPGGGRQWIAGDGPYNAHLTGDSGVGFLAVGAVLLLAALWLEKRVVQAGLVAAVVHGVPHLLFHLRHPNEGLSGFDTVASNGSLAFGSLLALVLLVAVSREGKGKAALMNRSPDSALQSKQTAMERIN